MMTTDNSQSFEVPENSRATLTALVKRAAGLSNRQARELIERGGVAVDGERVQDPVRRPEGRSTVTLSKPSERRRRLINGPGFRGVYLDRALLAVDKHPGLVVIPTSRRDDDEDQPLVARVAAALRLAGHRADPLWVVHRIDRATSGLVLFARSEAAFRSLEGQFKARTPQREYLAWTAGIPEPHKGRLVHHLVEDAHTHRVEAVRDKRDLRGKEAILDYEVEAIATGTIPAARLRVRLITGRRNQIRAQFAACGWPLLGDRWYHEASSVRSTLMERAALHATRLTLLHPIKEHLLKLEAKSPADLLALDQRLFSATGGCGDAR